MPATNIALFTPEQITQYATQFLEQDFTPLVIEEVLTPMPPSPRGAAFYQNRILKRVGLPTPRGIGNNVAPAVTLLSEKVNLKAASWELDLILDQEDMFREEMVNANGIGPSINLWGQLQEGAMMAHRQLRDYCLLYGEANTDIIGLLSNSSTPTIVWPMIPQDSTGDENSSMLFSLINEVLNNSNTVVMPDTILLSNATLQFLEQQRINAVTANNTSVIEYFRKTYPSVRFVGSPKMAGAGPSGQDVIWCGKTQGTKYFATNTPIPYMASAISVEGFSYRIATMSRFFDVFNNYAYASVKIYVPPANA